MTITGEEKEPDKIAFNHRNLMKAPKNLEGSLQESPISLPDHGQPVKQEWNIVWVSFFFFSFLLLCLFLNRILCSPG